jgi:hypothetical protein
MTSARVFKFLLVLLFAAPVLATTPAISVGVDHWQTPDVGHRYSPNYSPTNDWRPTAAWVRGQAEFTLGNGLTASLAAQHHAVDGSRIDRAELDWRATSDTGARIGVLPYRLAWCRTYDRTSVWIKEPDAFCRFPGLSEITQGGFGVQAYKSVTLGGWMVDSMAGVYKPTVDGQDKKLAIYVPVGPTVRHDKIGASVNAIHLQTGTQIRAAWLRSWLDQDDARAVRRPYQRQLRYDTAFVGIEGDPWPGITARLTAAAYIGDQVHAANAYAFNARSVTAELSHRRGAHEFATGLSHYQNTTRYAGSPRAQTLDVPSLSLAWRYQIDRHLFVVTQATRGMDDAMTASGVATARAGSSYGVRLGANF